MAGQIVTVSNQKGGVGKSTLVHLLSYGLAHKGYRVLAVDLDQQGNLTYIVDVDEPNISTYDLLTGKASATDILIKAGEIDILPANRNLAGIDLEITQIGKEYRLRDALTHVIEDYDYIVIDTPPTLSLLTINALTASAYVLIPTQADILSLQGLGQLYSTIQAVQQYTNSDLTIAGIIVTRHDSRTILTRQITNMLEDTANAMATSVFNTKIRDAIAIKEVQAQRTDFFKYDTKSNVYKDVQALINEILEKVKE